jgi:hypothetical protein
MAGAVPTAVAACLLGAACLAVAATPLVHTGLANLVLYFGAVCAAFGAMRPALADIARPDDVFASLPIRTWTRFLDAVRRPPWEELTAAATLWLEVMHPARPWHTAVLGAMLTAYLLAVHLTESGASPTVLKPQLRALVAGACLLAAAAGAAALPTAPTLLRVLAAAAATAAAALVLPL